MKVYDNDKIKTYRSLFELANYNVLVGRKDGLLLGIDENTIQELRDTIDNNNYLHRENDRLNNIIDLKSFFIQDLLELISYSNDNDLHTKVHLTGIEYQEKLKELKKGK